MSLLVPIALFGWLAVAVVIFAVLLPQRAVVVSFLFAWMFLPNAGYDLPGVPDYTKASAAAYGALVGMVLFRPRNLLSFRLSRFDIPMFVWCLCPFVSSIANGLGAYDGLSAVVETVINWGLPYYLGRVCLRDLSGMRELTWWLFLGGLIYVPFCWFEIRLSPQLHGLVYGFGRTRGIEYATELGSWGSRPNVFMGNGLAVGMFMTAASLAGSSLWFFGGLKRLWGYRAGWLVTILIVTAFMCKNMAALTLLCCGFMSLLVVRWWGSRLLVWGLVLVAPAYMVVRSTGDWTGESLAALAGEVNERREESLQFRLKNENILVAKALQRPVFGWGRWGRARVYREDGQDVSITDGLWIIALGNTGLVGLAAATCTLLVPAVWILRRYPAKVWGTSDFAPVAAIAVLMALYMIDNLLNAMLNPVYILAAGGLSSFLGARPVRTGQASRCEAPARSHNPLTEPTAPSVIAGAHTRLGGPS